MKKIKINQIILIFLVVAGILLSFLINRFTGTGKETNLTNNSVNYKRIVSITPSLTECIYALGCGDRVVGVGDFTKYPPEVLNKPMVGGYLNPNTEVIISLKPDLVIIQGKQKKLADFCEINGIRYERFEIDKISDVTACIKKLGSILGVSGRADSLCAEIENGLNAIAKKTSKEKRMKVFYSLGHTPGNLNTVYTVGRNSFVSQLIEIAGGENICDDNTILYPEISKETIVMRAPEIIIESLTQKENPAQYKDRLKEDWKRLTTIPAASEGKIFMMEETAAEIPGPRLVYAAKYFTGLIHPGLLDE